VTLLEIDTVRVSVGDALQQFRDHTLGRLRAQPGYRGVWVLATPEGKGLLMSLWDTEADARVDGDRAFYGEELGHFATMFRSAPGREQYDVLYVDVPTEKKS
jgi:hypothetical protein